MGQRSTHPQQDQPNPTSERKPCWPKYPNSLKKFSSRSAVFIGHEDLFPGWFIKGQTEFQLSLEDPSEPGVLIDVKTLLGDDTYYYDETERRLSIHINSSSYNPILIAVEGHTVVVRKFPRDTRALKLVDPDLLQSVLGSDCASLTDEIMEEYKQTEEGKAVLEQIADAKANAPQQ